MSLWLWEKVQKMLCISDTSPMKKDLHVHLYGCLSAEDLWNIGKDSYQKRRLMLEWYAQEYQKLGVSKLIQ